MTLKPIDLWTSDDVREMETSELVICLASPECMIGTRFDQMQLAQARGMEWDDATRKTVREAMDRVLEWVRAEINRRIPRNNPFLPPTPTEKPPLIYPRWTDPNATATEVRDSIIGIVGMMANARTEEMQAAYNAALAREGKVDSPDGPVYPDGHPSVGERITPEQAVALARNVIQRHSSSSDKPSVQLALRVINGAHERDLLRQALDEALSGWENEAIDNQGDCHPCRNRIAELRSRFVPR